MRYVHHAALLLSHTPYICSSTTELVKSDSLQARRRNTPQNRERFFKIPSRYDRGASSDDVKIITEDVMIPWESNGSPMAVQCHSVAVPWRIQGSPMAGPWPCYFATTVGWGSHGTPW